MCVCEMSYVDTKLKIDCEVEEKLVYTYTYIVVQLIMLLKASALKSAL